MHYIRKYIYLISIILLIMISIIIIITKNKLIKEEKEILVTNEIEVQEENKKEECSLYKVDIKGEVINPGVYEIDSSKRVIDVINLSGGLTSNANTSLINLAKKVTDEMVIIIYSNNEVENTNTKEVVTKIVEKECVCPEINNDSCLNNAIEDSYLPENNKISLNTCTIEDLLLISGIGEIKANSIIDYQKKYGFNKIEDLLEVNGIGNSTYEKIKDYFKL